MHLEPHAECLELRRVGHGGVQREVVGLELGVVDPRQHVVVDRDVTWCGTAPDDGLGMGAGRGTVVVVALGVVVVVVLGVVVVVVLGVVVVVAVGAVVSVGVAAAARAMTCEGPNGVRARATAATRATETAGYATTARRRKRRAGPLLLFFTGNSLGLLVVGKRPWVAR